MNVVEIYQTARAAGFPIATAVKMTAIALRESGGNPAAFNGNSKTGDRSYGLWQINMYGSLAAERLRAFGITSEDQLLNPATNAHAAFILWNGNDTNLSRHWYIDRAGTPYGYAEKYRENLRLAEEAALIAGESPASGHPTFFADDAGEQNAESWILLAAAGLILAAVVVEL